MICQNCRTEVDDDLIFCTNCGARLFETPGERETVLMNDPATAESERETVLRNAPATAPVDPVKPPKPSSNLKWAALIVALVAIPATIFGLLLLQSRNRPAVTSNVNRTPSPTATATRKPSNANQNSNANLKSNANSVNANANSQTPGDAEIVEVMSERIEIAPTEHYAVPFAVENPTARLTGKVSVLEGEKVEVFVYIKSEFDDYFPDPVHKVSSFETRKSEDSNQVLVEQDYVLVFVNKSDKPLVIRGDFKLGPVEKAAK